MTFLSVVYTLNQQLCTWKHTRVVLNLLGWRDVLNGAVIRAQREPSRSAVCPTSYIIQCGFCLFFERFLGEETPGEMKNHC